MPDDHSALVADILKALDHKQSVKKNGDTLPGWVTRVVTPGRIMWTFLAICNVVSLIWLAGIQFRDVQVRLEASDATAGIVKGLEENTRKQGEFNSELAVTIEDLMKERTALATTVRTLNDRLAVLRGDFNRTVQLQIVPRLDKIEKAQTTAAQFSGEK